MTSRMIASWGVLTAFTALSALYVGFCWTVGQELAKRITRGKQ